jgi:hypothetical protein
MKQIKYIISFLTSVLCTACFVSNNAYLAKVSERNPEKVTRLSFFHYTDSVFPNDDLAKLFFLKELKIAGDPKKIINPFKINAENLEKLERLEYLTFSNYGFKEFPHEICNCKSLRRLLVGATYIRSLPKEIEKLENLEELDVRLNLITHLPDEIANLKNLKKLILGNNPFEIIPQSILSLEKLEYLDISDPEGWLYMWSDDLPGLKDANTKVDYYNFKNIATLNALLKKTSIKRINITVHNGSELAFLLNHPDSDVNIKKLSVIFKEK